MRGPRTAMLVTVAASMLAATAALPATARAFPQGPLESNLQGDYAIRSAGPFGIAPDPTGYGAFAATCDYGECCYTYAYTNLGGTGDVRAIVYRGREGANGTPVIPLPARRASSTGTAGGCTSDVPNNVVAQLMDHPERFYVQILRSVGPYRTIRGQLDDRVYGRRSTLPPKGGLFTDPVMLLRNGAGASQGAFGAIVLHPSNPRAIRFCYGFTVRNARITSVTIRRGNEQDGTPDPVLLSLAVYQFRTAVRGGHGCLVPKSAAFNELELHPERFYLDFYSPDIETGRPQSPHSFNKELRSS